MFKKYTRVFVILLSALMPIVVHAQRTVPVTFILAKKFSGQGVSAVVRQTGGADSEYIIAIREESLSLETLAACLNSLRRVIDISQGDKSRRVDVRIAESAVLRSADNDAQARGLLQRLKVAPLRQVKTITGEVRSFEVRVTVGP